MKKNLLSKTALIAAFCFPFSQAHSQITITRADFPSVGDQSINAHDTIHAVTEGSAGAAQTWNLTGIVNDYTDTTFFLNPSTTPYALSFLSANLVGYNSTDSSYFYANAGNDSIVVHGI